MNLISDSSSLLCPLSNQVFWVCKTDKIRWCWRGIIITSKVSHSCKIVAAAILVFFRKSHLKMSLIWKITYTLWTTMQLTGDSNPFTWYMLVIFITLKSHQIKLKIIKCNCLQISIRSNKKQPFKLLLALLFWTILVGLRLDMRVYFCPKLIINWKSM